MNIIYKSFNINDLIFIEPINENNRITVQRGFFSIFLPPYFANDEIRKKLILTIIDRYLGDISRDVATKFSDICKEYIKKLKTLEEVEKDINDYISTIISLEEIDKSRLIEDMKVFLLKVITVTEYKHNSNEKEIIILEEDKEKIKEELDIYLGVNTMTVYPDATGYIQYIKENY